MSNDNTDYQKLLIFPLSLPNLDFIHPDTCILNANEAISLCHWSACPAMLATEDECTGCMMEGNAFVILDPEERGFRHILSSPDLPPEHFLIQFNVVKLPEHVLVNTELIDKHLRSANLFTKMAGLGYPLSKDSSTTEEVEDYALDLLMRRELLDEGAE